MRRALAIVPMAAVLALSAVVTASAHDGGGGDGRDDDHHGQSSSSSRSGVGFKARLLPSTATTGPVLFNVKPGALPWTLAKGEARVSNGELRVQVRGLVVPAAPQNGTNPVTTLSASLVCNGAIAATSAAVPFSTTGDAQIRQAITVPPTCLAPAILVHPGTDTTLYIAANG